MPSWETAVGNEDSHIDLTTAPVRQSAPIRLNRIKRSLAHRAALLGYRLQWDGDTAVLLEYSYALERYTVGPSIRGLLGVRSLLNQLQEKAA